MGLGAFVTGLSLISSFIFCICFILKPFFPKLVVFPEFEFQIFLGTSIILLLKIIIRKYEKYLATSTIPGCGMQYIAHVKGQCL